MEKVEEESERNGIMMSRMKCGDKSWRLIGLYINGDMEEKLQNLSEWLEVRGERDNILIARTGSCEGRVAMEEDETESEEEKRNSKDKKINKEGRKLVDYTG